MTAILTPTPKAQFLANDGTPLAGGKLYTYAAGATTPLATYVSSAGTTANTNPIILDSRGEADVWLGSAAYKFALYTADNTLIWTVDNIIGVAGADLVTYLPAGSAAVTTTVQAKLRESVSVKDFGVVGDGTTDDSAAFAAALAAASTVFIPANCTILLTNITVNKSVRVYGANQATSIIQWKAASAEANLMSWSAGLYSVAFDTLTIDGNYTNQTDSTGYYGAIGFSGTGGSTLSLNNVAFLNGRIEDVYVTGTSTSLPVYLSIVGCTFKNGLVGTSTRAACAVQMVENVEAKISGNTLIQETKPTAYGRAGFLMQRATGSTNAYFGKFVATGNVFVNFGRGTASTLGCIDCYSGGKLVVISNNLADTPIGRAFCVKSDQGAVQIQNNSVWGYDGLAANLPAIVLYNSTVSTTTELARTAIISGNTVSDSVRTDGFGIVADGSNAAGVATFDSLLISNNAIYGTYAGGIYARYIKNLSVVGNIIEGASVDSLRFDSIVGGLLISSNNISGATNIGITASPSMTACNITVKGNDIYNCANGINVSAAASYSFQNNTINNASAYAFKTAGSTAASLISGNLLTSVTNVWSKTGTDSQLLFAGNSSGTALFTSTRTVTIATGVISVFADWHYVDTESSAATDDLDTINGGYEGLRLTLRAANSARDVVCKDGTGNLKLAGDFTLNNTEDSISLLYSGGVWVETSRSDNGA